MDKVQHFEIPADDTNRAKQFYTDTFGWNMQDWPMPDGSTYVGVLTGPTDTKEHKPAESGFINGGMFKRGGESFPITSPVITVVVENIEKSLEKVKANGGSVIAPTQEVPEMGLYAYIKDTEGNVMGVWQNLKKS